MKSTGFIFVVFILFTFRYTLYSMEKPDMVPDSLNADLPSSDTDNKKVQAFNRTLI